MASKRKKSMTQGREAWESLPGILERRGSGGGEMSDPHSQGPAQNGAMPAPTLLTMWESREPTGPRFPPLYKSNGNLKWGHAHEYGIQAHEKDES